MQLQRLIQTDTDTDATAAADTVAGTDTDTDTDTGADTDTDHHQGVPRRASAICSSPTGLLISLGRRPRARMSAKSLSPICSPPAWSVSSTCPSPGWKALSILASSASCSGVRDAEVARAGRSRRLRGANCWPGVRDFMAPAGRFMATAARLKELAAKIATT